MKKSMIGPFLALSLVLLFAGSAFAVDINLSVAASLREVVTELSDTFAKSHAGVTFQNNFGASGVLAKQIESGAPADIFFSANLEWMDYLKERKLLDEKSISTFAHNVLVFVGKPESKVTRLEDVTKLEKIAIGSPKSVPAGEYAMQAFNKAGIDKQLENKLVMARDVRECLLYADRGEVDGAFVYKTDAEEMAKNVKILFIVQQDLYPRVTYPMALTTGGSKKAEAIAYLKFLQSAEAKSVLAKHGFVVK
jgi:molybdate transport system substrate-binding protein